MIIPFQKAYLDVVLVPSGLLLIFLYHLILLYRYLHKPLTTVLGYENRDKRMWVDKVTQATDPKEVQNALTTITTNITAATFLATISLTLCSLLGAWITNSSLTGKLVPSEIIYGNTKPAFLPIKYLTLIACFLVAFSFFIQAARHFVHANYLISMPGNGTSAFRFKVEFEVMRGGEFWSVGLRALYVALAIMMWFFGPIPMFVSAVLMVVVLYLHDYKKVDDLKDG